MGAQPLKTLEHRGGSRIAGPFIAHGAWKGIQPVTRLLQASPGLVVSAAPPGSIARTWTYSLESPRVLAHAPWTCSLCVGTLKILLVEVCARLTMGLSWLSQVKPNHSEYNFVRRTCVP